MTVSAGLNSVSVYRTVPIEGGVMREDIVGMRVYASTAQNFVADATTLKYSGSSLSYTISGLLGGTTYYVKTALISSFLGDSYTEADLVISDEGSVTTQKAPGSLNVIVSTPAVVLSASNTGVVSSYAGSGTTIRVYDGASEVVYDGVGTANGTWKVVASGSGLTLGSITDSGNSATVGNHSNLTVDSTTVTYTITGKTALGSSFSLSVTQTLSKAKSGSTGSQGTRGWTIARISGDWNQTSAESAIRSVVTANGSSPTTPIAGDTVFYTGGANQYNGSAWVASGQFIDGSLLVNGTVIGEHLAAQFSIKAGGKIIAGDEINGVVLSSDKTVKVMSSGITVCQLGAIGSSYGFQAYSPTGSLLFDSLANTAFLADTEKDNYVVGDSSSFPSYANSTAGKFNIAIGKDTLTGDASASRTANTAVGSGALKVCSTSYNVAVGHNSLKLLSGGTYNTAVGSSANAFISSVNKSTSIGAFSEAFDNSVSVGASSGNQTAEFSVQIGVYSGNSSGSNSVSIGSFAEAGQSSSAIGYMAGNSDSAYSVAIGHQAGNSTTDYNVSVGYLASLVSTGGKVIAIGAFSALNSSLADHLTAIGYYAGADTVGSNYGVMIGTYAGRYAKASYATLLGYNAGSVCETNGTIAIGHSAANSVVTAPATVVGYQTCYSAVEAQYITAFGYQTLRNSTTSSANTVVGYRSAYNITTGSNNTFVGNGTGTAVIAGSNNVFIGNLAGSEGADVSNCVSIGGYLNPETNTILLSSGDGTALRARCSSKGEWDFIGKAGYKTTESVTQTTSRSTGVTLNSLTGKITLFSEAVVAGAVTSFTVTNSKVSANDVVSIHQVSGTSPLFVSCTGVSAGSFRVSITSPIAITSATAALRFIVLLGG